MKNIKLINKQALEVLIDKGYTDATKLNDVSIASKGKKSRGKTYFAKEVLAFIAWDTLGEDHNDKDYQAWKNNRG